MTTDANVRRDIQYSLGRADRRWAQQHLANALPPDRIDALVRELYAQVVVAIQDQRLQEANERGCLARLIEAVTGEWSPNGDVGAQTMAALQQVRRVEQYLLSIHGDQKGAA